jgi:hypothetical protein
VLQVLAYTSAVFSVIPAILALIYIRKAESSLQILKLLFVFAGVVEIIATSLAYLKINNQLLGDVYFLVEGILIGLFCYYKLGKKYKWRFVLLGLTYLAVGIYTSLFLDPAFGFNSIFRTTESLIILILSGSVLIHIINKEGVNLLQIPEFWIISGFFIYFTVNISLFLSGKFIMSSDNSELRQLWIIHSLVNILANILFTLGIVRIKPKV